MEVSKPSQSRSHLAENRLPDGDSIAQKTLSMMASVESLPLVLPKPVPLTRSKSSWVLRIPKFLKPSDRKVFSHFWKDHPKDYHPLQVFGKAVFENRFSQIYTTSESVGKSFAYSGTSRTCIVCDPSIPTQNFILRLSKLSDRILSELIASNIIRCPEGYSTGQSAYNCCLVNWYKPSHSIGLHADDEKEMDNRFPILSLSWGGPRRFLLRPKKHTKDALEKVMEFNLQDGDLLVMGGQCQHEFKHEVPKLRVKDGLVDNRISWTVRKMTLRQANKRSHHEISSA